MVRSALIRAHGGPDVIEWIDEELPPPAAGEVRMRNTAIGVNFIDTYHRSGLYPGQLPGRLGLEAAGVIEAVGEGVADWRPGDRACTFGPARGAYATERNVPAATLLPIPQDIADDVAAASLLKGCTAEFLVERCGKVQPGDAVLVHAAAGGVGLILVQWLKAVGARVVGTVSSDEKAALARAAGADEIIRYDHEDVAQRVKAWTAGKGVAVAFDGVGKSSWRASLGSVAPRGLIVSYGNASGPVTGVDLGALAQAGSVFVTRPTLFSYHATPEESRAGVARLWEMIGSGKVEVTIGRRYALEDAAEAHRDLEARATAGSSILLP